MLGQRITPLERVGDLRSRRQGVVSVDCSDECDSRQSRRRQRNRHDFADRRDGAIILAAAHVAGVDRIFRVGGAQAVAALAFGTQTIPKVDKIVGPGNIFVATAKRMVFGEVNIDSIAGPSEILLLADDSGRSAACRRRHAFAGRAR